MAYSVRYFLGKATKGSDSSFPEEVVTSSFPTVEEALETLGSYLMDLGAISDISEIDTRYLKVEYSELPYVFTEPRTWKGSLSKLLGIDMVAFRRLLAKGGRKAVMETYLKMIDPKTPIEDKLRIFGEYWDGSGGRRGKKKKPSPEESGKSSLGGVND